MKSVARMTGCNAHTVKLNHSVENHFYEKTLSGFHFGMVPAVHFSAIPWSSELFPNFLPFWMETPLAWAGVFLGAFAFCLAALFSFSHKLVSCFLALYVVLRILIWTTITGIRGTILFLEGSSSCFFFLPCANNKTVWNKKHLKGKKAPQKAPPNSLLYLLFMFCGCSH